MDEDEKGSGM